MSIFAKKSKKPQNIQEIQSAFNQLVFELGDLTFRKTVVQQELSRLAEEVNSRIQKMEALGKQAKVAQAAAKAELEATIIKGQANEADDPTA